MLKYSLGLDISCEKIDACISAIDTNQNVVVKSTTHISNSLSGFKHLDDWIHKHHKDKSIPIVICMEATGIYYENCALYLFDKGYAVSVILPNKAKKYIQALGLKSKNDKIDAKGLSRMGAEQCLSVWQPLGKYFYELRLLTRQHQNLNEQMTITRNRLHAIEHAMYRNKIVEKQLRKEIDFLEKQVKETTKIIEKHIHGNTEIKQKVENICTIKGVAILTVAILLAETNGFALFENARQLVSYAGLDVVENQSGFHKGKTRISKKCNSRIRRALYMPAFVVITCKQIHFLNLYERTLDKHNVKMKSYVAVQKKLLTTIYALWKKNEKFNPDHNILKQEQELASRHPRENESKKNSHVQDVTTQGKHPVNDHSLLPLGKTKLKKYP